MCKLCNAMEVDSGVVNMSDVHKLVLQHDLKFRWMVVPTAVHGD